jgi:heme exporter protein C
LTTRPIRLLGLLAAVALLAGLVMGFGVAPREVNQGNVQRIMYLHVPSVVTAYLAFVIVLVASVGYLATRELAWDRWAAGAAEIGTIFAGLTIVSGSIWGKPTWGTWWTWDARLTSTAILFVTYVGYLLLRNVTEDRERRARLAAVLGILATLEIPIVHFSVSWWRTLHQPATVLTPTPSAMSAVIGWALFANWVAFTLLFAYLLVKRVRVSRLADEVLA